jgi:serine/threonine protein kinase
MRLCSARTLEQAAEESLEQKDPRHYADLAARFASLVRAVAKLHEAGIVHRDIKPANILIDSEGRYLLADFGSAVGASEPAGLGSECGGTVLYMSPEQLCPGADPRDPRADIYSLGVTLYEVATGYQPFPLLADAEVARWKLTRLPPLPRQLNPYLPIALEAMIRQASDPRPDMRHSTAEELARDLERFFCRRRARSRPGGPMVG